MQRKAVAGLASVVALAAGLAAAAQKAKESPLTNRFNRSARVWKLSARNSVRFGISRVRGIGSAEERRAQLDEQFAIRTAEDVAKELGEMKGVLMKAGQLISFIFEALPDEAQEALATLAGRRRADGPDPRCQRRRRRLRQATREGVPRLGRTCRSPLHRSVRSTEPITHDGRDVAVKVQYPGVHEAIETDLDAAEVMYAMFSSMMLKGLDAKGLVDELRDRMREELDYSIEAGNLAEFEARFQGHPWVRIPKLVPELCSGRVLTTEWIDGMTFDQFRNTESYETKQRAAEVIWRFAQGAIMRHGIFNGDPHPGNYKFHHDGSVTFLDYGLVKRWSPGEWETLAPDRRRDHHRPRPRAAGARDGAVEVPARWPRPRSCAGVRLRVEPVHPVSHRRVHLHARAGCATRSPRSSTCRAPTRR